jgi:NAD(P)-dependent dehydrogenase (short-subunit alcohol dehydrogenase family)
MDRTTEIAEFSGLTAAVTGGSSGIGAATVAVLAARGARVAVLDVTAPPDADAVAGSLFVACDVTSSDGVVAAFRTIEAELGGLDILVNNAGIGAQGDVTAQDGDAWLRLLDVNVVGMARVTSAALPLLRRSPHAAIVNTASVVAVLGVPDRALYAASKGAVLALTLAMAADHVREGIRVNAVAPGTTDTPWVGRLLASADDPAAAAEALRRRQPLGRLVAAQEVAHAIAYLASPLSASTTGTVLGVDGGMLTLRVPPR